MFSSSRILLRSLSLSPCKCMAKKAVTNMMIHVRPDHIEMLTALEIFAFESPVQVLTQQKWQNTTNLQKKKKTKIPIHYNNDSDCDLADFLKPGLLEPMAYSLQNTSNHNFFPLMKKTGKKCLHFLPTPWESAPSAGLFKRLPRN